MKPKGAKLLPFRYDDIARLLPQIRARDYQEIEALGQTMPDMLLYSLRASRESWICMSDDHKVLAVLGDVDAGHGLGFPWLVGTCHLVGYRRQFLRLCRPVVAKMANHYDLLLNYVHAENQDAIGWLETLGFTLEEPAPFGPQGAMFRRFYLTQDPNRSLPVCVPLH